MTSSTQTPVVISTCLGGYGLSVAAQKAIALRKGFNTPYLIESYQSGVTTMVVPVDEALDGDTYYVWGPKGPAVVLDSAAFTAMLECDTLPRDDVDVIAVVRELGYEDSAAQFAELQIVVATSGDWDIADCDGQESLIEYPEYDN